MTRKTTRRDFLKATTVASVGYMALAGFTPKVSAAPSERIRFAGIGIGGKGESDIRHAAMFADVVAICDTDKKSLARAQTLYPKAKAYTDFRELFEKEEANIDAATISTADHMHAPMGLMAMRMKKHVYVQKPLARTMYECRLMSKVAKETGVCTQMGNQRSASDNLRRQAAEIKAGVYGDIKEIHVWTNRPIWPQGPETIRTMKAFEEKVRRENPEKADEMIAAMKKMNDEQFANIDWKLWLGVAKEREYFPGEKAKERGHNIYHHFGWRGWWDFGTGALGDIACHELNAFMAALDLSKPVSVVAKTSGHDFDVFPSSSEIVFEYPDTPERKGFKFVWYDGGWTPDREMLSGHGFTYPERMPGGGSVIIGSEGVRGAGKTVKKEGVTVPEPRLAPRYPGSNGKPAEKQDDDPRNVFELVTAIKENKPELCFSNFPNQAGPLTEAMLLGNLAVWTAAKPNEWGEKVMWDSENMNITNLADLKTPRVDELIKPIYPENYRLD